MKGQRHFFADKHIYTQIKKTLYVLLLLCCVFVSKNALALTLQIPQNIPLEVPFDADIDDQWHLTADYLTTLDNGAIIEAQGDVVLQRGQDIIEAQLARYYTATGWVFARDEVYVKFGVDELYAEEAEFDLETSTGFLKNGNVYMASPHIFFEGESITKYFGDSYSFTNAHITACDPADPAWGLKAAIATIEIDGYATLTNAQVVIGSADMPPVPYLVIPARRTRQSGFLKPDYGISSLHGVYYTQPWFWAIDEESDATFYGSYLHNSGLLLSAEYRSHTTINNKLWLGVDYLISTNSNYENNFWLRGMGDGSIGQSLWEYKFNVDYVSSPTFLADTNSLLTGWENTNASLLGFFGRELGEYYRDRVTEGYVSRRWDDIEFTLGFEYTQDPNYRNLLPSDQDPTVQKLPEANVFVYPLAMETFPLQFDASFTGSYNYRILGSSGIRTEIIPRLSLPFDFGYFSTLTQLSLNHRNYFASSSSVTTAPLEQNNFGDGTSSKTLLQFNFEALTQATRVWDFNADSHFTESVENIGSIALLGLRHLVEPRLEYIFVEDKDQSELPYYFQSDRIVGINELNLSIENLFTSKMGRVVQGSEGENSAHLSTSFHNVARLTFSGGYDFNEASRTDYLNEFPRRPIKDITLDAEIYGFGLSINAFASYSLYGDGLTRFDLGMDVPLFALDRYVDWDISYSYRTSMYDYQNIMRYATSQNISLLSSQSLLRNTFVITPISSISLYLDHYLNLETRETYEFDVSASYNDDCYSIVASYSYTPLEHKYGVSIVLPGIFD